MKQSSKAIFVCLLVVLLAASSCVTKKQVAAMQKDWKRQLDAANDDLGKCGEKLNGFMAQLGECEKEKTRLKAELDNAQKTVTVREDQINDLKDQISDVKTQRDKQYSQVGNLTVLSQAANENIKETLSQLERKDKYIHLLQAAKTKADSINLALAVNLKSVLEQGLDDTDVEVKVDKTVVFVNLSDKMLYQSGKAVITPQANVVLGKIAQIVKSRPELEVMVEGYTDNVPIKNACMDDNWDLSVKRATSVVRALQWSHGVDPNRLVAAGRGQYNILASNDTEAGRAINRRTRIILLPKLDQFYDLLNPNNVPK
jgi:chemotaxis protein MotB